MTALVVSTAWADHGGTLRSAPMSPYIDALVWGGITFLIVVVAVITIHGRRRP